MSLSLDRKVGAEIKKWFADIIVLKFSVRFLMGKFKSIKLRRQLIVAALAMLTLFMQGCGSGDGKDTSKASSSQTQSGSSKDGELDANADIKSDKKSDDKKKDEDTEDPRFDKVIVNEGVEAAVKDNAPEAASVDGFYDFSYMNFSEVYSNAELKKCFDRLADIIENADCEMSFSYKNIETGAYVSYNNYTRFMTCSTIKAPYVKSILEKGINLDDVITRNYIWPGDDGTVALAPYGQKYTAKQLIEYAILESDNTAYYLLDQTYGYWDFNNLMYSLGANYSLGDSWIFTYCTSDDMMKCFEDIYRFGEENEYGKWLVDLLSDTDVNIQIGQALGNKYKVAQKYGSEFNESVFNDCAIVYADSPFVLSVFSNQYPETEEACKLFKELAVVFDDINTLLVTQ